MRAVFLLLICLAAVVNGQSPRTAEEYNNRGLDRQAQGDVDGAIEDYTKALSMRDKPNVIATAYNNRANARLNKGDLDGAIAGLRKSD